MRFAVVSEFFDIKDPETEDPIGSVKREKVRVKVVNVQGRLSVARTYETYTSGGRLSSLSTWSRAIEEPTTKVRTLRSGDAQTYELIDPSQSYIEVGDVIEEVSDIPEVE